MKKYIFLLSFLFCATLSFAQVKVSEFVEVSVPDGNFEVPDIVSKKRTKLKFLGVRIVTTPLTVTPSATGNTTNLNRIVTTASGDAYFIDWFGNATRMGSAGVSPLSLISNDLNNKLHLGSDNKLYVDGVDANSLISSDPSNMLGVGSGDNKLYVPTPSIPTLQQVVNEGNTTNGDIITTQSVKASKLVSTLNAIDATIQSTNVTQNRTFELPDNNGTLALTSDIPPPQAVPNLQQVLAAGNTANNNIELGPFNSLIVGDNVGVGGNLYVANYLNCEGILQSKEIRIGEFNNPVVGAISSTNLTSAQIFQLPNKSGTVAVTSDIIPYNFGNGVGLTAVGFGLGGSPITQPISISCNDNSFDFFNVSSFNFTSPYTTANDNFGIVGGKGVQPTNFYKKVGNHTGKIGLMEVAGNTTSYLRQRELFGTNTRGAYCETGKNTTGNYLATLYYQKSGSLFGNMKRGITFDSIGAKIEGLGTGSNTEILYIDPITSIITRSPAPTTAGDGWGSQVAITSGSIIGNGSSTPLQLNGEQINPGNSKYYGTNVSGTKGYFDLAGNVSVAINSSHLTGNGSTLPLGINTSPTGLPNDATFTNNLKKKWSTRDLTDVSATVPTNGQILVYNSVTGLYEPSVNNGPTGKVRIQMQKGTVLNINTGWQNAVISGSWIDGLAGGSSAGFANGVFTSTKVADYAVSFGIEFGNISASSGQSVSIEILLNGFKKAQVPYYFQTTSSAPAMVNMTYLVHLNVGATLSFAVSNNLAGTVTVGQNAYTNFISIQEL